MLRVNDMGTSSPLGMHDNAFLIIRFQLSGMHNFDHGKLYHRLLARDQPEIKSRDVGGCLVQ